MKIIIPGGTGHIGRTLAKTYHAAGHDVVVLSRNARPSPWKIVPWDGETLGPWANEIDGADVVINLAGRTVNCRYTPRNRCEIWSSRVRSVRAISAAIEKATRPPQLWIQAGTATVYENGYDTPHDEATGVMGGMEPNAPEEWRFSMDVSTAWEGEFDRAIVPNTRKVTLRTSLVFSPDRGSVFDYLIGLVRFGLGGTAGPGNQYVSWIHIADFQRALDWMIANADLKGPVNMAAPNPLPNAEMMAQLRKAWGISWGIPTPEWLLNIGAIFLRTEPELILKSRKVVPGKLIDSGFEFKFNHFADAARQLCEDWRAESSR
jgi:uncharacterized protein (TIGR01777 family)